MKKIILILALLIFATGCTVTYQKHTGIIECDMAIMLAKIKSQEGNSSFEIGRYMDKCYEEMKNKNRDKK